MPAPSSVRKVIDCYGLGISLESFSGGDLIAGICSMDGRQRDLNSCHAT